MSHPKLLDNICRRSFLGLTVIGTQNIRLTSASSEDNPGSSTTSATTRSISSDHFQGHDNDEPLPPTGAHLNKSINLADDLPFLSLISEEKPLNSEPAQSNYGNLNSSMTGKMEDVIKEVTCCNSSSTVLTVETKQTVTTQTYKMDVPEKKFDDIAERLTMGLTQHLNSDKVAQDALLAVVAKLMERKDEKTSKCDDSKKKFHSQARISPKKIQLRPYSLLYKTSALKSDTSDGADGPVINLLSSPQLSKTLKFDLSAGESSEDDSEPSEKDPESMLAYFKGPHVQYDEVSEHNSWDRLDGDSFPNGQDELDKFNLLRSNTEDEDEEDPPGNPVGSDIASSNSLMNPAENQDNIDESDPVQADELSDFDPRHEPGFEEPAYEKNIQSPRSQMKSHLLSFDSSAQNLPFNLTIFFSLPDITKIPPAIQTGLASLFHAPEPSQARRKNEIGLGDVPSGSMNISFQPRRKDDEVRMASGVVNDESTADHAAGLGISLGTSAVNVENGIYFPSLAHLSPSRLWEKSDLSQTSETTEDEYKNGLGTLTLKNKSNSLLTGSANTEETIGLKASMRGLGKTFNEIMLPKSKKIQETHRLEASPSNDNLQLALKIPPSGFPYPVTDEKRSTGLRFEWKQPSLIQKKTEETKSDLELGLNLPNFRAKLKAPKIWGSSKAPEENITNRRQVDLQAVDPIARLRLGEVGLEIAAPRRMANADERNIDNDDSQKVQKTRDINRYIPFKRTEKPYKARTSDSVALKYKPDLLGIKRAPKVRKSPLVTSSNPQA